MNENEKPTTVTLPREILLQLRKEADYNRRPLVRHLFTVARYLGIGAMVHAWLLGPRFDANDLWSWAYVLAWPVPLSGWVLAKLGIFFLYAFVISAICALAWWAAVEIAERRGRARRRAAGFRQPPRSWDARQ